MLGTCMALPIRTFSLSVVARYGQPYGSTVLGLRSENLDFTEESDHCANPTSVSVSGG
jgi:hypothetical protein